MKSEGAIEILLRDRMVAAGTANVVTPHVEAHDYAITAIRERDELLERLRSIDILDDSLAKKIDYWHTRCGEAERRNQELEKAWDAIYRWCDKNDCPVTKVVFQDMDPRNKPAPKREKIGQE